MLKNLKFKNVRSKPFFSEGNDLHQDVLIAKMKFKDETEQRIAFQKIRKEHSSSCEHDYDCCGQIYQNAKIVKLSRNRVKLTVTPYVNV